MPSADTIPIRQHTCLKVPGVLRIGTLTLLGALLAATSMAAQSLVPDDVLTFRKRSISDWLPVGIRAGSFLFTPGIELAAAYDDNIYRTKNNGESDYITTVKPAIGIQSDWSRHALFLGAEGDLGFYADNSASNYRDYGLIASAQYDITEGTYLIFAVSRTKRHVSRGLSGDVSGAAPVEYTATREQVRFTRDLSLLKLTLSGMNENTDISDTTALGVTTSSFTGRDSQQLGGRLAYEYMPGNAWFATATYNTTNYHLPGGAARDAHGMDYKAGLKFETLHGLRGSVFASYINRTYGYGLSDTRRPYPGIHLFWDATPITTLSAWLDRSFYETGVTGAAGTVRTQRKMMVKHRFTDRIAGDISGGYNHYEYVGSTGALNRTTRVGYGGAGVELRTSENFGLRAAYDMERRHSPLTADEYKDRRISLSLTYMY